MAEQDEPGLADLRNIGKAALKDLEVLGIVSVPQLVGILPPPQERRA